MLLLGHVSASDVLTQLPAAGGLLASEGIGGALLHQGRYHSHHLPRMAAMHGPRKAGGR